MLPVRSYLFVPGSAPALLRKAALGEADALVADLEDGVALSQKPLARSSVVEWLRQGVEQPVWVRVNQGDALDDDLDALAPVAALLAGLVVAKADASSVRRAGRLRVPLAPMIETAASIEAAPELARLPHVAMLQIGEVDLAADVSLSPSADDAELGWPRGRVVFASRAAGLPAPPAPVSTELGDMDVFRASTVRLARQGFVGRMCIHPRQVAVANESFTPSAEAVARAERLLAAFDRALLAGDAVLTDEHDRMVDEAVVRSARRTLELHAGAAARSARL
ncbi:HpcH/HpaI aldolase/citrate lyase family protein [Microbacterium allomyrinae]|uniref:HpcH/HpaI aldolase/citrate lyase domain-containing protein n=1 Tax=Microbacterium allomyrinae TaxID=2830666 RepID=A0A9X1LX01_9MICO|nr:aldolase/citrate lyase family protein [Microbacterium allomyrinae]MCC2033188.1 hypothetical protein [Microbacterium allomyrinae]